MSKDLEERYYSEQVPELLTALQRIADALERQVELFEGQAAAREDSQADKTLQNEQRRQRFKAQLEKLAEVDRMARDLRRKLEEKQAEEAAAQARLESNSAAGGDDAVEEGDTADKSPVPTDN